MSEINMEFIYDIVKKNPVHREGPDGSFRTHDWVYDKILELIKPGDVTLETGAGVSTLTFAHSPAKRHICVTPAAEEEQDIRKAALAAGIDLGKVQFIIDNSAEVLPRIIEPLDFAMIDGCHGPFIPFIDFYFAARNLKAGGHILVDDIQLIAPKIMFEFLKTETACVKIVHHDERAALVQILDNTFIQNDWPNSGINFIAENKSILTQDVLAQFDQPFPQPWQQD